MQLCPVHSTGYPEPGPLNRAVGCGLIQITQSILTQDRDSGCNSHNRCGFDQTNYELGNMYFLYRLFNLFASFVLTAGIRTRRWTGMPTTRLEGAGLKRCAHTNDCGELFMFTPHTVDWAVSSRPLPGEPQPQE